MRRLIVPVFIALTTNVSPLLAGNVLTGEHGIFTRIYIPYSDQDALSINSVGNEISVQLSEGETLSARGFWDKISKNRVSSVSIDGNLMTLEISCDCEYYHLASEGGIILDIYDQGANNNETIYDAGGVVGENIPEIQPVLSMPAQKNETVRLIDIIQTDLRDDHNAYANAFFSIENEGYGQAILSQTAHNYAEKCPNEDDINPAYYTGGKYWDAVADANFVLNSSGDIGEHFIDLAQLYIRNGMPEEATLILQRLPDTPNVMNLEKVAHIISGDNVSNSDQWRTCGVSAQFWNVIGSGSLGAMSDIEQKAIFSFYYNLPKNIQLVVHDRWIDILNNAETSSDVLFFENMRPENIVSVNQPDRWGERRFIEYSQKIANGEIEDHPEIERMAESLEYFATDSDAVESLFAASFRLLISRGDAEAAYNELLLYPQINGKDEYLSEVFELAINNDDEDLVLRAYYDFGVSSLGAEQKNEINKILSNLGFSPEGSTTEGGGGSPDLVGSRSEEADYSPINVDDSITLAQARDIIFKNDAFLEALNFDAAN